MKEDLCKLSRDGLWKSRTARLPTFLSQLLPEIKNVLSCPPMDNLAIRQSDNCFPLSHLLPLHTCAPPIYHSLFSELPPSLHLPPFFIFWRLTLSSNSPSASFHFYHDCKIFPRRSSANLFVRNLWQINSVRHALFSCRDKSSVGKIYF